MRRNLPVPRRWMVLGVRLVLDAAAAFRSLLRGRTSEAAAVVRGSAAGLLRHPWGEVVPPPSVRDTGTEEGTYRGNAALAYHLRGVERTSELLPATVGWEGRSDG